MIKKVLAITLAIQFTFPLSLIAGVHQSETAPTAKDIAVLLDKPNKNAKDYINGILVGTGVTAFALYSAYTTIRLSKLSAKNKELAKEIASLTAAFNKESASNAKAFETLSTNITELSAQNAKQGKEIISLNTRLAAQGRTGREHGKKISSLQKHSETLRKEVTDISSEVKLLKESGENLTSVVNNHAGIINNHAQGINNAFSTLKQHAGIINQNAVIGEELMRRMDERNAPRPVIGFGSKQTNIELPKVAKKAEDAYTNIISSLKLDIGRLGTKESFTSPAWLNSAKLFARKNAGKLGLAGAAILVAAAMLPKTAQASAISQRRLVFARSLKQARADNSDYYAITALELAKTDKALVAQVIAEEAKQDASLYPLLSSQIAVLSSPQTARLAAAMTRAFAAAAAQENKYSLLSTLKTADYSANPYALGR